MTEQELFDRLDTKAWARRITLASTGITVALTWERDSAKPIISEWVKERDDELAALRGLVNVLAVESDLKGNDANNWFMADWDYEVGLTGEQRELLRGLFPEGRPHA